MTEKKYRNEKGKESYIGSYQFDDFLVSNTKEHGHWAFRKALESPGEKVFIEFEDTPRNSGNWYAGYIKFDPDTKIMTMWGNVPIKCPSSCQHHRGSICPVCGLNG